MKKYILVLLFFGVVLISLAVDDYYKIHQVVVIQSYHRGYRWTDKLDEGIISTIKANDPKIRVTTEFLDTKRFSDAKYLNTMKDILIAKYKDSSFDVLITADDNAFNIIKEIRDIAFKDIPIVFCGLNNFQDYMLEGMTNVTGVNENMDIKKNLQLISDLNPDASKLLIINDTTPTGLKISEEFTTALRPFKNRFEIEFARDVSFDELLTKVNNLTDEYVVLYALFLKDNADKFIEYDESIIRIVESSVAPVYVSWDFSLGYGAIGGAVTSGFLHGQHAAGLALEILEGEQADNIAINKLGNSEYILDWQAMAEWKTSTSLAPLNTKYINKPISKFEEHKGLIIRLIVIIAVLFIIIFSLIFITFKKIMLQKKLTSSNSKLRELKDNLKQEVTSRTSELTVEKNFINNVLNNEQAIVIVFAKTGKIVRVNKFTKDLFVINDAPDTKDIIWDFLINNDAKKSLLKFIKTQNSKEILAEKIIMRNKQGSIYTIDANFSIIEDQESAYHYVLTGSDVSDRELYISKLRAERSKFRAVYDNIGVALVSISLTGKIFMVNDFFLNLTGYNRKEIENKTSWYEFIHESSLEMMKEKRKARYDFPNDKPTETYEVKIIHKKGFIIDGLLSVVFVPHSNEVIASMIDITERNKFVSQQQRELLNNKALVTSNHDFLLDFSNDLIHPIETISGMCEIILRDSQQQAHRESIKIINDSSTQLFYIVNEVLEFIRSDSNQMADITQEVDIQDEVGKIIQFALCRLDFTEVWLKVSKDIPATFNLNKFKFMKVLLILFIKMFSEINEKSMVLEILSEPKQAEVLKFILRYKNVQDDEDKTLIKVDLAKSNSKCKMLELNDFKLNLVVCKKVLESMGGTLNINIDKDNKQYYQFSVTEQLISKSKDEVTFQPNYHTLHRLFSKSISNSKLVNEQSIAKENPLKIILLNYAKTSHHILKRMLESLGYDVKLSPVSVEINEIFETDTYDMLFIDLHTKCANNIDDIKLIRNMKDNINQPYVVALNSFFCKEMEHVDSKEFNELVNFDYRETLNFDLLITVLTKAWEVKVNK